MGDEPGDDGRVIRGPVDALPILRALDGLNLIERTWSR